MTRLLCRSAGEVPRYRDEPIAMTDSSGREEATTLRIVCSVNDNFDREEAGPGVYTGSTTIGELGN